MQAVNSARFSIGVDFGGTNLRIGAYTQEAGLLETVLLPTRLRDGPGAVSDDMSGGIRRLLGRYSPQYALAGIGVGSPGPLELPPVDCGSPRIFPAGTASNCAPRSNEHWERACSWKMTPTLPPSRNMRSAGARSWEPIRCACSLWEQDWALESSCTGESGTE